MDAGIVGHLIKKEELSGVSAAAITAAAVDRARSKQRGGQRLTLEHFVVGFVFLAMGLAVAGTACFLEKILEPKKYSIP